MRYRDSIERSAEYVRLALPMMARQQAAMHPISFSVWYEHVAGMNAALSIELDRAIRTGTSLTEDATQALYRRYIAGLDEQSAQQVTEGFHRVLSDMSDSATQASNQASRFGNALEEWSGVLADQPGPALGREAASSIADCRIVRGGSNEFVNAISISVGVAHYRSGESSTDFVDRADSALYESKAQGRNRVTVDTAG